MAVTKTWQKTGPGCKRKVVRRKYQTEITDFKDGKANQITHVHKKSGKSHTHKPGRGLLGGIFPKW